MREQCRNRPLEHDSTEVFIYLCACTVRVPSDPHSHTANTTTIPIQGNYFGHDEQGRRMMEQLFVRMCPTSLSEAEAS